jgi:hypothetical protein
MEDRPGTRTHVTPSPLILGSRSHKAFAAPLSLFLQFEVKASGVGARFNSNAVQFSGADVGSP